MAQRMMSKNRLRTGLLCGAVALLGARVGAARQLPPDAATPATVWTPNACASVTDGQVLTLDWNPAFEHAGSVIGMQQFELRLAKEGHEAEVRRTRSGLMLSAMWSRSRQGVQNPFTELPDGSYRIAFHLNLQDVAPGRYHIVYADAVPRTAADYRGEVPAMTNSPLSAPLCLDVVAAEKRRSR